MIAVRPVRCGLGIIRRAPCDLGCGAGCAVPSSARCSGHKKSPMRVMHGASFLTLL